MSSVTRSYLSTGGKMGRARREGLRLPEGAGIAVQSRAVGSGLATLGIPTKLRRLEHLLSKLLNFSEPVSSSLEWGS